MLFNITLTTALCTLFEFILQEIIIVCVYVESLWVKHLFKIMY